MPAYEYRCDACACSFEKRQKMSAAALTQCPECGGHVHRLISGGAGAITKGGAGSQSSALPPCASGGACCGGQGACGQGMFCEN